jgi:hypothetical protein
MRESKLTELLKGINPYEFKKFGEFINTPFHNKSSKILHLYDLINKNYDKFDANTFTSENIAKEIYGDKINKEQNARTLISNFTSLLEKFLSYSEFDKSIIQNKILLLKALRKRNILKTFDMVSKEISDIQSKDFNKNTDYYYNDFTFKETWLNYHGEDLDLELDKSYNEMSLNADYMFIVTKLKILNTAISRKILSGINIYKRYWGIDNIIKYIEKNIEEIKTNHPIIYSEYKILMMVTDSINTRHFYDLQNYFFSNNKKFKDEELEEVYYSLSNYCVNNIALGNDNLIKELYKIHKTIEQTGFYDKNKNLMYTDFSAVIICGLNMNELEWVNYFFDKYKQNIASEYKRDTINLTASLILFYEKKYKECISILNKISYKNTFFYLKTKETLIKCYYELGEKYLLYPVIDAVKHYLKRHKEVLSIHYERYIMFLNFVIGLIKSENKHKPEQKILMKKLDENRTIIARNWLIEKVIELS